MASGAWVVLIVLGTIFVDSLYHWLMHDFCNEIEREMLQAAVVELMFLGVLSVAAILFQNLIVGITHSSSWQAFDFIHIALFFTGVLRPVVGLFLYISIRREWGFKRLRKGEGLFKTTLMVGSHSKTCIEFYQEFFFGFGSFYSYLCCGQSDEKESGQGHGHDHDHGHGHSADSWVPVGYLSNAMKVTIKLRRLWGEADGEDHYYTDLAYRSEIQAIRNCLIQGYLRQDWCVCASLASLAAFALALFFDFA